jgi:hypothetical protein
MQGHAIEEWAVRHRIAAAARDTREALSRLARHGRELNAAIANARRMGVSGEEIISAGRTEADR